MLGKKTRIPDHLTYRESSVYEYVDELITRGGRLKGFYVSSSSSLGVKILMTLFVQRGEAGFE